MNIAFVAGFGSNSARHRLVTELPGFQQIPLQQSVFAGCVYETFATKVCHSKPQQRGMWGGPLTTAIPDPQPFDFV